MSDPMHAVIVARARAYFRDRYGKPETATPGACLYWAVSVIKAAETFDVRLVLQAGTAMFRRVPPALDDGDLTKSTHFSYVWTEGAERAPLPVRKSPHDSVERICLPEMHVWAGDPITQNLVDVSTAYLKAQCENVLRMANTPAPERVWRDVDPPAYVWETAADIDRRGWLYQPSAAATMLAASIARVQ